MGIVEVMDKIFGGGENRGIMQGLGLTIGGIVLLIVAAVLPTISALALATMLLTDPIGYLAAVASIAMISNVLYIIGYILLIIGIIGIIWWILRSRDIVS